MKNHGSWHRADQAEWEWASRPDALFRLLADEYKPFRLCVALCRGECKWSTISLKKAGLVHDLVEKIWLGNDLVYVLTEIDISVCSRLILDLLNHLECGVRLELSSGCSDQIPGKGYTPPLSYRFWREEVRASQSTRPSSINQCISQFQM